MGSANQQDPQERLYNQYGEKLAAYVHRRIHNWTEADDVIAKVWCKAIANWPGHDHPERFLFRVAKHDVIDWYRKAGAARLEAYDDELTEEAIASPARYWHECHDPAVTVPPRIDLHQAMGSLSAQVREAFTLTVVDGLPCEIVATMVGIKPETVRTYVKRARAKLKKHEALHGYARTR